MLARFRTYIRQHHLALLALFIALGGTAWALERDRVRSKHIVDGQVKSADIEDDGVGAADVNESNLGRVPSAFAAVELNGLEAQDFARAGSEAWQPLPLHGEISVCHYANYGNGHNNAAYFRDPAGVVHLRGLVKAIDGFQLACGTSSIDNDLLAQELPLGYRPASREVFTITANNKPARIDVLSDGHLVLETPNYPTWADAKAFFSLDGISYRCAPSGEDGCP